MRERGWEVLDVILVTGDGYVDHPAFGAALLGRLLEREGFRVGILDAPDLDGDPRGEDGLPAPRLFTGVTAGNIDSMLSNYTASRQRRQRDIYRPGGAGGRPNRATIAYTGIARHRFRDTPVIVGGLEAGPRRFAHYDYWQDRVRGSILADSKADLLVWGMGEQAILEIARRRREGRSLSGIPGTCELRSVEELPDGARELPSFERVREDPDRLAEIFRAVREENRPGGRPLVQQHGGRWVLQWPPAPPMATADLDALYELPFRRLAHPDHDAVGGVGALETVRWSVTTHRGCLADCSFCSITSHQGRPIASRSGESVLREVARLAARSDFHGTITDVGGPSANMYGLGCRKLEAGEPCLDRDCLLPETCPALRLRPRSERYRGLLAEVRSVPGVKHAFVGSGIRHDLLLDGKGAPLPLHRELLEHHVSGRMKLAPEHCAPRVLRAMNKPSFEILEHYEEFWRADCARAGREQHLVGYWLVAHPGTSMRDAVELFAKLLERNQSPEQVQEFIPLPLTRSSVQYVSGRDPLTDESLPVPRGGRERRIHKALVRWKAPENAALVEEALLETGRGDLVREFRRRARKARRPEEKGKSDGRPWE
jgi:uncharacterized radical SAM protein YgiQ